MAGRNWSRWRAAVVMAGMLGLAASASLLGITLGARDLPTAANVAQLISVVLVVPTLAIGLMVWWRRSSRPSSAPTTSAVAAAEDVLAGLVSEQWKIEAAIRSLNDPAPIPVQWHLTGPARESASASQFASAPGCVGSSDRVDELAEWFRSLPHRRLVILGGPGSGKTTLAVQVLRRILLSLGTAVELARRLLHAVAIA